MDRQNLKQVIIDQQSYLRKPDRLIDRDMDIEWYMKGNEVVVISGIRRCGKSTLLKIIANRLDVPYLLVDFDDIRLMDFSIKDFPLLESIALEISGTENPVFLLDEVQNVDNWDRWVADMYRRDVKIFATGSNSKLLGPEISTHLTGRNKMLVLHPFSFAEYLRLENISYGKDLSTLERNRIRSFFSTYMLKGGFPLVLRNDDILLSRQYLEDIINRDIIARYGIREIRELKDIIVYLLTNAGSITPYSSILAMTGLKSISTVKRFVDHIVSVFLIYRINRFDYSIKRQIPFKYYASDTSFLETAAFNTSNNLGKKLENLVAVELMRRGMDTYYHKKKRECDFVVKKGLKIVMAIQVTLSLEDPKVRKRELEGLEDAMALYDLDQGLILAMDTREELNTNFGKISVMPVWEWMLQEADKTVIRS